MKTKHFIWILLIYLCLILIEGCTIKNVDVDLEIFKAQNKALTDKVVEMDKEQSVMKQRIDKLENLQEDFNNQVKRINNYKSLIYPVYIVKTWEKDRDCLWNIADKKLGNPWRWTEIYKLNQDKIIDPDLIYPKQELKLPK